MDDSRIARLNPSQPWLCTRSACALAVILGWLCICQASVSLAVTPRSPEVRKLIDSGLDRLTREGDFRLGGKCVVGLAFLKAGRRAHPRVQEAVDMCRQVMDEEKTFDVYSNGLAVIFLSEVSATRYSGEIRFYLDALMARQKSHGGWGYDARTTGDTSQTQYAALALWEANRRGFSIDGGAVERLADWLLRTQDPNGAWGYQGTVAASETPVEQHQISVCMVAAGVGSTLICADLFGSLTGSGGAFVEADTEPLPEALQSSTGNALPVRPTIENREIELPQLTKAIEHANEWMDENYTIRPERYNHYYVYALERYKSFQELFDGMSPQEPQWYNDGYDYLTEKLSPQGGWDTTGCRAAVDTAFGVLFLLRSTQNAIKASLGEGTLIGGRGLPADIANATMRGGQIVLPQTFTRLEEMLQMFDDDRAEALDQLARSSASLVVGSVDRRSFRRLQQMVHGADPDVRILAVRTLSRTGELDFVPTLIYALSDPDRRVVLEARDGLRFVSRRFTGFGLPDSFSEKDRYEVSDKWKQWYKALRPDAIFE